MRHQKIRVRLSDISRLNTDEKNRETHTLDLQGLLFQALLFIGSSFLLLITFYYSYYATRSIHLPAFLVCLLLMLIFILIFIPPIEQTKTVYIVPLWYSFFLRLLCFFLGILLIVLMYETAQSEDLLKRNVGVLIVIGLVLSAIETLKEGKTRSLRKFFSKVVLIFVWLPKFYFGYVFEAVRSIFWLIKAIRWVIVTKLWALSKILSTWWLAKANQWSIVTKLWGLSKRLFPNSFKLNANGPHSHGVNIPTCVPWQLIHLSDLHLRPLKKPLLEGNIYRDLLQESALLADISSQVSRFKGESTIVITGDLTDTGERRDIIVAKRFLRKCAAISQVKSVIVIPGNHDINISGSFWGGTRLGTYQPIANFFARGGAFASNATATRLHRFARLLRSPGRTLHGRTPQAPIIVATSQRPQLLTSLGDVGLVYIPTAGNSWHLLSNAIGKIQSRRLERALRLNSNVLLSHHHLEGFTNEAPNFSELPPLKYAAMVANGRKQFASNLAVFQDRILFCLHGHTHIKRSYNLKVPNATSVLPVFCAPSCLIEKNKEGAGYQLFCSTRNIMNVIYREWNGTVYV